MYCGKEMESKTAKKKFCSTSCRVYFNREKTKTPFKQTFVSTGALAPKTLAELKALCPSGLDMFDKAKWIQDNRLKYGI